MRKALLAVGLITTLALFIFFTRNASAPGPLGNSNGDNRIADSPGFNKQLYSINTPGSIWWIVSKVRPLNPIDYAPTDLTVPSVPLRKETNSSEMRLRKEAVFALEQMVSDAKKMNINILLVSAYRSYQRQISVYNGWVQQYGQAGADRISARPGTSEHQTGLAVDLGSAIRACELEECFADLPEGKWLAAHAHEYGFGIRYPQGKEAVTGYQYEPWHFRYVGKELSQELHKQNIQTLEEFFGIVPDKQPY